MDELSRCAGLSRFRMLRAFQRQVGVAPSVYRRTLRLERAKRRLAAGEGRPRPQPASAL
jgi:AraC-like DNA-binding protein